ncbi:hypothetical protein KAJ83_16705 [Marivibrio halodurans]|uniref:Fenitrothion hydrolase n=1 Tax=Marivibrio halodurans TaxID=2039722 RepID=A0A8J7S1K2_9PROT|nr:hypothetical protein [Marivibrio halodurans]MBP5858662.1 hypothetical protein [Marivibrio halodurans]
MNVRISLPLCFPIAAAGLSLGAGAAHAHTSERGLVMLLPTDYYLAGGALAVAVSFAVLALAPMGRGEWRVAAREGAAAREAGDGQSARGPAWASWLGFLLFAALVVSGFVGSRDPLGNPLSLGIWTGLWVMVVLAHAVLGDLWRAINPWSGPVRLLSRLTAPLVVRLFPGRGTVPPFRLPARIGHGAAIAQFLAFAWFELIDPAPDDPARLAVAAGVYWLVNALAMLLFGEGEWRRRGEIFSVFFGFIALLAPVRWVEGGGRPRPRLRWPGAGVLAAPAPSVSAACFIVLALATVSFDGASRTFWYLDLIGVNPLEFPGRTAVMAENTIGLLAAALLLGAVYFGAVALGRRLAGTGTVPAAAMLVTTLLPISLAYHFSHYLTQLLVNGQYMLATLGDPLGRGANWLGYTERQVTTSFLNDYHAVEWIWNAQAGAIVLGHVWAVWLAHVMVGRALVGGALPAGGAAPPDRMRATLAELPLAVLMIGYTVFGLWLLSSPTGA